MKIQNALEEKGRSIVNVRIDLRPGLFKVGNSEKSRYFWSILEKNNLAYFVLENDDYVRLF